MQSAVDKLKKVQGSPSFQKQIEEMERLTSSNAFNNQMRLAGTATEAATRAWTGFDSARMVFEEMSSHQSLVDNAFLGLSAVETVGVGALAAREYMKGIDTLSDYIGKNASMMDSLASTALKGLDLDNSIMKAAKGIAEQFKTPSLAETVIGKSIFTDSCLQDMKQNAMGIGGLEISTIHENAMGVGGLEISTIHDSLTGLIGNQEAMLSAIEGVVGDRWNDIGNLESAAITAAKIAQELSRKVIVKPQVEEENKASGDNNNSGDLDLTFEPLAMTGTATTITPEKIGDSGRKKAFCLLIFIFIVQSIWDDIIVPQINDRVITPMIEKYMEKGDDQSERELNNNIKKLPMLEGVTIVSDFRFISGPDVRLHEGATTKSKVLHTLKHGQAITVLEKRKKWLNVSCSLGNDSVEGWLPSTYTRRFV